MFVFLVSHGCYMALHDDAVGLSAVCDSRWYFLIILTIFNHPAREESWLLHISGILSVMFLLCGFLTLPWVGL